MKTVERTYTVEATIEEGRILEKALHRFYVELKAEAKDNPEAYVKNSDLRNKVRDMRNYFAHWDNRSYMGEDA